MPFPSPEISWLASLIGALWPHDLTDDKQNTLSKFLPLPHALQVFRYSIICTTNLDQKKKLLQVLLCKFKNNMQYKTMSSTGVT